MLALAQDGQPSVERREPVLGIALFLEDIFLFFVYHFLIRVLLVLSGLVLS